MSRTYFTSKKITQRSKDPKMKDTVIASFGRLKPFGNCNEN